MSEHLASADWEALQEGSVSSQQVLSWFRHFLACGDCRERLASLLSAPMREREVNRVLSTEEDASYDAALDRAFASALRFTRKRDPVCEAFAIVETKGALELLCGPRRLLSIPVYEALMERSWALRRDDPCKMVLFAQAAMGVASTLSRKRYGGRKVADHQCRAWVELANAYRVADNLDGAERAIGNAVEVFTWGTQSDDLNARLLDVHASIHADRRRFAEVFPALDAVYQLHIRRGDRHNAGRALIAKGLYGDYAGESEKAMQLLQQGLDMIDRERDPELAYMAVHNLARALMGCGQFKEARSVLWPNLGRPDLAGGRIGRLKLVWLEGQINVGLGQLDRSERAFMKAKQGFEEALRLYDAALVSLDLAAVWMRQGRDEEARTTVLATVKVFYSLKIHRELIAAVFFLEKTFEARVATLEALEEVKRYLERAEHDPNARFEPPTSR